MKNRGGLMFENTMNNLKIGVDVGGTKIELCWLTQWARYWVPPVFPPDMATMP